MKKVVKAYLTICLSVLILCFIGCGASNQESISSSQNHNFNNVSKNTNMITKPESKESEKIKDQNTNKEGKEENLKDNKNQSKDSLNKDKDVLNKDANSKKSDQAVDKNKKDNNTSKEVKTTSKTSRSSSSLSQESNKKILDENKNKDKSQNQNKDKIQNQNKDKSQNEKIENREDEESFTLIVSKDMKGKTSRKPQILFKKQIKRFNDKNAMTYLRENCTVIENGGFIKSINGNHNLYPIPSSKKTEEQKKNKILGIDWFIYLNERKSSKGANDIIPMKGDILHFDIHEWDRSEFSF